MLKMSEGGGCLCGLCGPYYFFPRIEEATRAREAARRAQYEAERSTHDNTNDHTYMFDCHCYFACYYH